MGTTMTGKHPILVRLGLGNEVINIEIEDDGRPFNPLKALEPDLELPLEQRSIGGLGIHLVRQ